MKIRHLFHRTRLVAISLLLALNVWVQPISLAHAVSTSTAVAALAAGSGQTQQIDRGGTPNGLTAGDWSAIQAQIEAGYYAIQPAAQGGYQAANRPQDWQVAFTARGPQVTPHDGAGWQWGLTLTGYGYAAEAAPSIENLAGVTPGLQAGQATLTYRWDANLSEWWVNTAAGLEQGFTLQQRPAGQAQGRPLQLDLAVSGTLTPIKQGEAIAFQDKNGAAVMTYANLHVTDAAGQAIPARLEITPLALTGKLAEGEGGRLRILVADADARYPLTIDPLLQQAYLKASNTGSGDVFGYSVAVSGDTVVVGAWGESSSATGVNGNQNDNSAANAGAAYVFTRSGTTWSQQAYLQASNTNAHDQFGTSVAVSGDTVVVGANYESSNATGVNGDGSDDSVPQAGAGYVFTRSGTTWSQQAYLKASNTGMGGGFGISVAVSGDTVVVGANYESSNATGVNGNQSDNSAWAAGAAYIFSEPPVVHTTIIQVLDEGNYPVGGAEVWQNGVLVGTSAANGVLELNVTVGDKLVARKLVKTVPSIRSHHNQGAGSDWAYHLYTTSLAIPAAGAPVPAIVTNPMATQTLILRKDNTLIGFNIGVSVEWDANAEYLENLRQGFELASAALYDASNGQMLFERVTIFDNNQAMGSADYQIRTSNKITPYVNAVGGLTSAPDKYIATGRYFVRSMLSDLGQWDLPANFRTLVHEFGHYGLYLYDSYFTYASSGWHRFDAYCTSPEIRTNQTPELNATIMDWHFGATEFSARGVPGAWDPGYCTQTEHYRKTGESDWETIIKNYRSSLPALWTLKTPIDYQQVVNGPHTIPLQEWSKVVLDQDVQTGTCEPAPVIQVVNPYGSPTGGVKVVLQRGNRLIDEGETDRQGNISLWGAVPGDRVTYEIPSLMLGTQRGADTAASLIATQIVSCASGRGSSVATGDTLVTPGTLSPAAFSLEIKISPSANPQQAALQVKSSAPLAGEPQVAWMQNGAPSIVTPTLSYDPIARAYQGVIPLANGLPTEGVLYVNAKDPQQHAVHTSRRVLLAQATPSDEQTIISSDGLAELFIPANSVQVSGQIGLQDQPIAGQQPSGLELLSGPYAIQPASGITQTGPINLTLHCLDVGSGNRKVDPNSSRIFSWDGLQWAPVTSTVGGEAQYVSAQVLISGTTYAVFGRWLQQVYLPLIMKN